MKTNEIIAAMQKSLTALMEQQANEVSELEAYKAKQKEKAETLKQSILSAFAAFIDEDEVTAPEPVESPAEDEEKALAEAKRMEEEADAALKQAKEPTEKEAAEAKRKADVKEAKEPAEKEAAEAKRKADVKEAKALAAKALAEKEENERKQRAAVAEAALQAAKDRKAAEDAAKAKAEAAKAAEEAKEATTQVGEEEDEGDGSMSEEEYNRLEILLDKYQSPVAKRAIQELKDAGHEETLKPRVNDNGWFCRTKEANDMIVDAVDKIAEEHRKALFTDGLSFMEHQKEAGVLARAQASAKSFAKQARVFELCPMTITDIPEANQMDALADAARICNVENLFSAPRFKEFLAEFGLTSMAQLTGDNIAKFYEYMFEQCTYNVFKEKE
nr:MAG: hypothetical protein [Bacteriophage sp.]